MPNKDSCRELALIGAGHTNLHIVRLWRTRPIPGVRLTLVSPFDRATYSGMLPGTLAGLYSQSDMEIDLARLTDAPGMRLIVAPAVGLDPRAQEISLAQQPPLRYDVASIGIGSTPLVIPALQNQPAALSIKPMATFIRRLEARLDELKTARKGQAPISAVIIGGGAAGVEIAFCLQQFLEQRKVAANLRLIDAGVAVLRGYLPKTGRLAMRELERRKIAVTLGQRVVGFEDRKLSLADGKDITADLVISATTAAPPGVLTNFDLPKAEDGFLAVRNSLQSTGAENVFVVGDTATFIEGEIPKAGVYAVRQGPVLWENIHRHLRDEPLQSFQPQSEFLSLLSTGDGRAIGQYRGFAFYGRWVWWWKDHIDRKFIRRFQE